MNSEQCIVQKVNVPRGADWGGGGDSILSILYIARSGTLVGLVVSKSHACYLLEGAGWDWVRILLGSNFSGSAGGVSGHA